MAAQFIENYKKQIKKCEKIANKAEAKLPLGIGYKSLRKAYIKIRHANKNDYELI